MLFSSGSYKLKLAQLIFVDNSSWHWNVGHNFQATATGQNDWIRAKISLKFLDNQFPKSFFCISSWLYCITKTNQPKGSESNWYILESKFQNLISTFNYWNDKIVRCEIERIKNQVHHCKLRLNKTIQTPVLGPGSLTANDWTTSFLVSRLHLGSIWQLV